MLSSRAPFATTAERRERAFIATNQVGSGIFLGAPPTGITSRQYVQSAQILNPLAMGPKVPAMRGHAVEANHLVYVSSFRRQPGFFSQLVSLNDAIFATSKN